MHKRLIEYAARQIRHGGVVAYPTESVFGLGCDPFNSAAVARILYLKKRTVDKGFIVIASDIEQLIPFVDDPDRAFTQQVIDSWPGPVTWIFTSHPSLPGWLNGYRHTIALRVTAHPVAAQLCSACGQAIVSTSANVSGHKPAKSALQTRIQFGNNLDFIVSGTPDQAGMGTEIRDAATNAILRPGPVRSGTIHSK